MNANYASVVPQLSVLPTLCIHCGNPNLDRRLSQFCCSGCETVYHWIQDHRLEKYYDIKTKDRPIRKSNPVSGPQEDYHYLDDPEFLKLYAWPTPEGHGMDFYLEGVHCAACVWITEKVAEFVGHVSFVRLNLGNSVASVRIDTQGSFAAVAQELQKMGYRPHPIQKGDHNLLQQRENRLSLIRLAVAGASAGNIMLLAISLYSGATGVMADRFRWMTLVLFLPVLLFSAIPFYKSAWKSIKSKELSIDIPIVFGILLGSLVSITNLVTGDDRVYFDSLSTVVFLLLSTRYLLKRTQQNALYSSSLLTFLTPSSVKKWNPSLAAFQEVRLDQVSVGDRVQVLPGECIPVDGVVLQGSTSINCALLSGESAPEPVISGGLVFAGTVNLANPITVQVTQSGSKTRLGRILESMQTLLTNKAPITVYADRISRYFVGAIVVLSGLTFLWGFHGNWHEGLNRALAIAIVTCPCTFALITPLAFSITLGKLAKAGILVKSPDILEKLTQIQTVFLDKTGTLTSGSPEVVRPESKETIQKFRNMGLTTWIVSGDRPFPVFKIAKEVGIPPENCISEASPERKSEIISQNEYALMAGDGANDAIALAQAYVGVAVKGGVEISLRAADIYLSHPGIKSISDIIIIARETLYIVKRNLFFSVFYNLIAGGFALAGKIDPLTAAVLMPLSAFTVFLSSIIGTSQIRKLFKELTS